MTVQVVKDSPPHATASRPWWRLKRVWLSLVGVAVLIGAAWGGRAVWLQRQSEFYARECRKALQDGEWDRLDQLAVSRGRLEPRKAAPLIYRAEAAQSRQDLTRALELLDQLPDEDPKTVPALLERVNLLFAMNRPLEAAECCERVLRLEPRAGEAHRRLIFFYSLSRQRSEALRCIDRAIKQGCDTPETYVYRLGIDYLIFTNGYSLNTQWLASAPENEHFLVARAIFVLGSGRLDEADAAEASNQDEVNPAETRKKHQVVLEQLQKRFPQNPELLTYLIEQAIIHGQTDRVAELLATAPPSAQEDSRFWRFKGWLHAARDELLESEEAYRKSMALNPYDYQSCRQLAVVMRRSGRSDPSAVLEDLATEGAALRKVILQLPDVSRVSRQLLQRIQAYAAECGDHQIANAIHTRLEGGE